MNIGESVRTGFLEIRSHKMRSFLSFSAIAFGVAAILYTFSHVNRMYERRQKAFDLAGPGRMEIEKNFQQKEKDKRGLSRGLRLEDAEAIRRGLPELYMVSPLKRSWEHVRYENFEQDLSVHGVTDEWRRRDWVYQLRGRFLNAEDVASSARVCVFLEPGGWSNEKEKPFWARFFKDDEYESFIKRTNMLGKTVRIQNEIFTVVGVLKNPPRDKDPRWFFRGDEAKLVLPITTLQRYLIESSGNNAAQDAVDEIQIDTGDERTILSMKRRIEALLDARHRGEKDYKIEDFRDMVQNILAEMRKQAIAILSIGIVAILAGGIGIMNVTLATIFSRVREIGIRRAIGATRSDILVQFVIEAMMLGFMGGIAGIGLGLAGITGLNSGVRGAEALEMLRWWHYASTLGISIGAGLLFSLYPAYQASKLDPIEALRYE